jgi:hypothetical protein
VIQILQSKSGSVGVSSSRRVDPPVASGCLRRREQRFPASAAILYRSVMNAVQFRRGRKRKISAESGSPENCGSSSDGLYSTEKPSGKQPGTGRGWRLSEHASAEERGTEPKCSCVDAKSETGMSTMAHGESVFNYLTSNQNR